MVEREDGRAQCAGDQSRDRAGPHQVVGAPLRNAQYDRREWRHGEQ